MPTCPRLVIRILPLLCSGLRCSSYLVCIQSVSDSFFMAQRDLWGGIYKNSAAWGDAQSLLWVGRGQVFCMICRHQLLPVSMNEHQMWAVRCPGWIKACVCPTLRTLLVVCVYLMWQPQQAWPPPERVEEWDAGIRIVPYSSSSGLCCAGARGHTSPGQ